MFSTDVSGSESDANTAQYHTQAGDVQFKVTKLKSVTKVVQNGRECLFNVIFLSVSVFLCVCHSGLVVQDF